MQVILMQLVDQSVNGPRSITAKFMKESDMTETTRTYLEEIASGDYEYDSLSFEWAMDENNVAWFSVCDGYFEVKIPSGCTITRVVNCVYNFDDVE